MSTKTLMSAEEYLRTSFEQGDCDYVDGEVIDRNVGEELHGNLQSLMVIILANVGRNSESAYDARPEFRSAARDTALRILRSGAGATE